MQLIRSWAAWTVAVGLFAATTGSALAADLGGPRGSMKDGPAYDAPAALWTGLYVGVQAGYAWSDARHTFEGGGGFAPFPANSDPDGFIGGGHVGYNLQRGSLVFGIEADIEGGDVSGSYIDLTGATSAGSVDMSWQGSLRARLGIAQGNALFYATGGWAFGRFDIGGSPGFVDIGCCGYSDTLHGWTVGAGAEVMISRNLSARIEYRYTDFGSTSGTLDPLYSFVTMPVELEIHAVRGGLSYRF